MTILPRFLVTLILSLTLIFMGGCDGDDASLKAVEGVTLTPESLSMAEDTQSADYIVKLEMTRPLNSRDMVVGHCQQ